MVRIPGGRDGEFAKLAVPQSQVLAAAYGLAISIPQGTRRVAVDMATSGQDYYVQVTVGATVGVDEYRAAGQTWYLGLEGDVLANDHKDATEAVSIKIKWGPAGGPATAKVQIYEAVAAL